MQNDQAPNDSLPTGVPPTSTVQKLDGTRPSTRKTKAPKPKELPGTSLQLSQESISSSSTASPSQLSFISSLKTSTESRESPAADLLSERLSRNGKQTLAKIDEQEEDSSPEQSVDGSNLDDLLNNDSTTKEFGNLHPMDFQFMDKINQHKDSLKNLKSTCKAYGLNPNTPRDTAAHSTANIVELAEYFMKIRKNDASVQHLDETDFEAMMRFGNLPPTLITDKDKRGEAANMFRRWWSPTLDDIARMTPSDTTSYPIPGVRALLGIAGYKVDDSTTSKTSAVDTFKRAQGMLAQQGYSMRAYSNDYFCVSTPEILSKASSHLLCLLYCAFGGDVDSFDLDNIEQIKTDILQSQADTIDSTVFAEENLTTLDAHDLRILCDMYGFDYAVTQQISGEALQRMIPGMLDTEFQHTPSYVPPKTHTTSKIAEHLRTLSLQPGGTPTRVARTTSKETEVAADGMHVADEEHWKPISTERRNAIPPPPAIGQGWSKHRLICHLQTVDPRPLAYYERMCPATLQTLVNSRSTDREYRLSNYNNIQQKISIDDLNITPHDTLRQMLAQLWACPTASLVNVPNPALSDEIWLALAPTGAPPLPGPVASTLSAPQTTGPIDPTTTAHLKQLEKVSNTVEKASETAAKSSRKADEGTRNLYDNLHDRSFHDLCCDDPPTSGASIPMSKLISTLYSGVYVQLSLRAYIDLANSFATVCFQDFVPLQQFMEQTSALHTITPYTIWRSEKPFPRKAIDYTNNDPELWRIIIRTLLNLTADILDLSPDVRTLCDIIANNVKQTIASFPHWSVTTCIFVAKRACEQFDLLRNHITSASRPTISWTIEGSTLGTGHVKYSTRTAIISAASTIPSWTTGRELAQFNLHMHDSSVLLRAGQASQYITPVAHSGDGPGQHPSGQTTIRPVTKGKHHCIHFLNSLGGGDPCPNGDEQCPYLHHTSFLTAFEWDRTWNMAAKHDIELDKQRIGKRPYDAEYPDGPPPTGLQSSHVPGAGKRKWRA